MVGNSRDSVPHIESVRDALASEGIGRDRLIDCLQVNDFGYKGVPSRDAGEIVSQVRDHLRRCQWRDGLAAPPYTYWNWEPSDRWEQWRDGFQDHFFKIVAAAADEIRAEFETQGVESKLALYGVPIAMAERPMRGITELVRHASAMKMLAPMDWIFAGFYPRTTTPITESNEAAYTERITHGIESIQRGYGGKECIPFGWLRPGLRGDDYARVYCRAVGQTSVDKLGLWLNPKDKYWAGRDIEQIRKAAPFLREWLEIKR
jgi:hypothetical protein